MMRLLLAIVLLGICLKSNAQWQTIHEGSIYSNDKDLYFLNRDTGFVVGNSLDGAYILRTHDGGAHWDSLAYEGHQFRNTYFPSSDTGYISCFYENQIAVMRTIDGGDSWQRVASNLESAVSIPYAISFFNNDTGIISLPSWWAITYNAGIDWIELPESHLFGTRDSDIDSDFYIGMDGAILISGSIDDFIFTRDTLSYQGSHSYLKAHDHRFISSAIGQNGQDLGYPNGSFGIITMGNGITQERNITYYPFLSRVFDLSWPSEEIIYAIHNSVYNEGNNVKFFMKSIDGGQTWFRQETVEPYYYGTSKIFCPNDTVCYAVGGYGGRIYKTINGGGPLLEEVTQVPLSVAEIKDDLNFSMAPNPTTGLVTIKSENEQIKRIEVFDLQGKSILTSFPKAFAASIDLTKDPSGIYLVQVLAGDKILGGKIVVE